MLRAARADSTPSYLPNVPGAAGVGLNPKPGGCVPLLAPSPDPSPSPALPIPPSLPHALLPCLLAPIGFAIGVYARDRGRVLALVFAMIPIVVFYLGDFIGAHLVRATDQAAFAFLPAALLALGGTPFCWRLLRA